jgi:hypothetical protein
MVALCDAQQAGCEDLGILSRRVLQRWRAEDEDGISVEMD